MPPSNKMADDLDKMLKETAYMESELIKLLIQNMDEVSALSLQLRSRVAELEVEVKSLKSKQQIDNDALWSTVRKIGVRS